VDQNLWMLAALLAATLALAVYLAARAAERRNPPIGKFITVDGVRLHYFERGRGPAVVLLHGNTVMLQDYISSGVLDEAALRCRVIAFDRPGFGYSDRPRTKVWTPSAQGKALSRSVAGAGCRSRRLRRPFVGNPGGRRHGHQSQRARALLDLVIGFLLSPLPV
jgi:pimeloyl-ACP methyl ester carboxylesterase